MNAKKLAIAAVALAAGLAAASVEARSRDDVQWSITIGNPAPWAVQTLPGPALLVPSHDGFYGRSYDRRYDGFYGHSYDRRHDGFRAAPTRWDRDGDGIPNRYDRVYNPRWDRDGDGIPNRYDRYDNLRHDGRAVRRW